MPVKQLPPYAIDPFTAADEEIKAWNDVEKAAAGGNMGPVNEHHFMTNAAAYELQRSVKALGIILMRVERVSIDTNTSLKAMTKALDENTAELRKNPPQRRRAPRG